MSELLLIAQISGKRIAFPAVDVNSVIEIDSLTPVPGAPLFISGLAAMRSKVLTVIHSATALGLKSSETGQEAIVVEQDGHLYALQVDVIEDVTQAHGATYEIKGSLGPGWRQAAGGMVDSSAGPVLLMDKAAIIAGPACKSQEADQADIRHG